MNLNGPEYNILNWLDILLENRNFNVADGLPQRARAYLLENFKVDYKKYDNVTGYRANDSYFSYAGDFVNGTLSLADCVVEATGGTVLKENDGSYCVGAEYWAGWVLTYYQWLSCRSFAYMFSKGLGITEVMAMYHPLHEADLSRFADAADRIIKSNSDGNHRGSPRTPTAPWRSAGRRMPAIP